MRRSAQKKLTEGRVRSALAGQLPWAPPSYTDPPICPLSEDEIEAIHEASLDVIEKIGIRFLNQEALDILKKAGCDVDDQSQNVKMDRQWVADKVTHAPSRFTITPRNRNKAITIGGGNFCFGQVASPPNIIELDKGRRPGTRKDYQDLIKLTQAYNCLHTICGYPVEPMDLHASVRHLHCFYDALVLSDKVLHVYSLGKERLEDGMEMIRIASGVPADEFYKTPRLFTNINSSSPLKHDFPMLDGAMRMARLGQPVVITPFTLAGAMAPVTIVGAVVQQNAETLAAIALLQEITPGTPVVYGAFTSNVDMKTGAPAFGTPEYVRAMQISGQMARRYNLPWRGSNANASNAPDGQAVWESAFSLQGATSGHANLIYHSAGWLEGGLSASFEKFVMDCEMLQQVIYTQKSVTVTPEDLAVDAIKEVGPDGHFFGAEHTQSRYKDAFYSPLLSDWSNYEAWEEAGALWTHQRASVQYKKIINEYELVPLDPAVLEELNTFVARRLEQGGAPTDF
jgi:trimethylamine--corrinoid protein Co-methyltransferase